jgi:hypothetical protein
MPRRHFDPLALFERTVGAWRGPYPKETDELDAVAAGKKAMSMFAWEPAGGGAELLEMLDRAFARGLTVALDRSSDKAVRVFVLQQDQMWRVPAYTMHWRSTFEHGKWTQAAEAHASALLGYTLAEREAWLQRLHWMQVGWGCKTIYTLLGDEQRSRVDELGHRAFGALEATTFFFHRSDHVLRKTAHKIVPSSATLARVGVEHAFAASLFQMPKLRTGKPHSLVTGTVTPSLAKRFNAALRSAVELLGPRGWST